MAVVSRLFEHDRLPPAKGEVPHGEAGDDGEAEPAVVRHEDEHDEVREYHLQGRCFSLRQLKVVSFYPRRSEQVKVWCIFFNFDFGDPNVGVGQ